MSIEFPLINKRTSFGIIPDSLIPVEVLTKFGYQPLEFVLDTGADFTMLPHHMAEQIFSPDLISPLTTETRKLN